MSVKPDYDYTWIETMHLIGYETATPPKQVRPQRSDLQRVLQVSTLHFGMDREELFAKTRKRDVTQARHMIRAYIKSKWTITLTEIGTLTGGCDHSTVLHSLQVHEDLMCVQRDYRKGYEAFTARCEAAGL